MSIGEPVQRSRRSSVIVAAGYGVGCHVSFVLGVGTMMVAMFFGMSRSLGTVPAPWTWIANGALLLQFPLVHSLLLTTRGRALMARLGRATAESLLWIDVGDDDLRHHRRPAGVHSLRILDTDDDDLVAGRRRRSGGDDRALCGVLVVAGQSDG